MRTSSLWLFIIVNCSFALATDDYLKGPTQRGLDYIRHVGLPLLEKEIDNLNIPDISGVTTTPLGAIQYKISKVHIEEVSIPISNLTIDETNGLTISCSHADLKFRSNWKFQEKSWPHIKDSGAIIIRMHDIHLELTVYLDTRDEKLPTVVTRKCELNIKKVHVKFSGGASWLYNLFANAIAADLKSIISKQVCNKVSHLVDDEGGKILREVPEVIKIVKEHLSLFSHMNPLGEPSINPTDR